MFRDDLSAQAVVFAFVLVLVLAYIVWSGFQAWRYEQSDHKGRSGAGNSADTAAVPDASTATNFQLATVYPNASFGATAFLIIPMLNAASLLFGNWVAERFLERLLNVISKHHTPHQYAAYSHSMPSLKRLTACISLFVFVAVTTFEVVFLARIGNAVIGAESSGYYGLLICIILLLALAAALGGQRTSLFSDRWLLPAAYFGMHLAVADLLLYGKPRDIDAVTAIVFLALIAMIVIRVSVAMRVTGSQSSRHWVIVGSTVWLLVSMIVAVFTGKLIISNNTINTIGATFNPGSSGLTWKVFFVAVLAAICPAILYNFVDFSFWQKYSMELEKFSSPEECAKAARRPFWLYLVESPLSWLLPVLLGLYAATAIQSKPGADPVGVLFGILTAEGMVGNFLALLLFGALAAIATSTATSYLASLGDLWKRDISNTPYDQNSNSLASGWHYIVGVALVMLLVLVPIDLLAKTTDQLILLLLTSFAPLSALTPLVAWPLLSGKRFSLGRSGRIGVVMAVLFGSAVGVVCGVLGVFQGVGPDALLFWLPIPLSFAIAWTCYVLSILLFAESTSPV